MIWGLRFGGADLKHKPRKYSDASGLIVCSDFDENDGDVVKILTTCGLIWRKTLHTSGNRRASRAPVDQPNLTT